MEQERTEFEWYLNHIVPHTGEEDVGCQAGEDVDFDLPLVDGGRRLEGLRLHSRDAGIE